MVAGWLLVGGIFLGILIFFKIFGKFVFGLILSFAILVGFLMLTYSLYTQIDTPDELRPSNLMSQGQDYFSWVGDFFDTASRTVDDVRNSGDEIKGKISDTDFNSEFISDRIENNT